MNLTELTELADLLIEVDAGYHLSERNDQGYMDTCLVGHQMMDGTEKVQRIRTLLDQWKAEHGLRKSRAKQ